MCIILYLILSHCPLDLIVNTLLICIIVQYYEFLESMRILHTNTLRDGNDVCCAN